MRIHKGFRCTAIKCNNYSGNVNIPFHRFPKDKERLNHIFSKINT